MRGRRGAAPTPRCQLVCSAYVGEQDAVEELRGLRAVLDRQLVQEVSYLCSRGGGGDGGGTKETRFEPGFWCITL